MTSKKPSFLIGPATIAVAQLLRESVVGYITTHEELRAAIGIDIGENRYRSAVGSARRILEREHGMLFDAVIGVGYQRLSNEEKSSRGDKRLGEIRRKAKRAASELSTVDIGELSNQQQATHLAKAAMFKMIERSTRSDVHKRLAVEAATNKSKDLDLKGFMHRLIAND